MRVCLIAEGCYPYVAGGVSSWIQMLVKGLPDYEFVIYAIGATKSLKGIYKYEIPSNVSEIHEVFLDQFADNGSRHVEGKHLKEEERLALISLLKGELEDWSVLFELFGENGRMKANDFLMSDDYLDIIMTLAADEFRNVPFKDAFWTIRSMLIPLLNLLSCKPVEADVYHTVATGYAGVLGSLFHHQTGKPFIVTEHGIYTREREEEILKADWVSVYFKKSWISFFTSLCRCAYHSADRIVSLFYGARKIQISLGAPAEKCSVIPNGVNVDRFAHIEPLPLQSDTFSIGAVIRVVPIKDIKTMIYSFNLVRLKRADAKLYLIGPTDEDETYYRECTELIENLGCENIEFVGRVDVAKWLGKLDLLILTSISEGQPFVLLEAMAAHRPVLSTNVGSFSEISYGFPDQFGKCGRVVPVMNPSAIAQGILEIGKSRQQMREMAENGYRRVNRYYRDDDFLKNYRSLYEEVRQEWQE